MGQGTMPPQQLIMDNNNAINLLSTEKQPNSEIEMKKCKCVLLGDGAVGKTSLTVSYTTNGYPTEYIPTAFDNYSVVVSVDNKPVQVQLCDTAGQDDFDSLRPLCYPDTDVFLLCFSVISPTSFHNITDKWYPEIRRSLSKVPIILIGTQSDLRNDVKILIDLARYKERPITESAANHMASQIGAESYIECSALTQQNLKEVFDRAIITALKYSDLRSQSGTKKQRSSGRRGKTKYTVVVCDANNPNSLRSHDVVSLKNKKPGWKKLCCFIS